MKKLNSLITFKSAVLSLLMIVLATPAWAADVTFDQWLASFDNRNAVTELNIPNDNVAKYSFRTNYNIATLFPKVKKVKFENKVTGIANNMFYGCVSLEEVYLPGALKTIGQYAFYHCTSLKSIDLPNYLEIIDGSAFCDCVWLEEINIPASVKTISYSAFNYCRNLKHAFIQSTNTTIADGAFPTTTRIVYAHMTLQEWLAQYPDKNAVTELYIPSNEVANSDSYRSYDNLATKFPNVKKVTISPNVNKLGSYIFKANETAIEESKLETVVIERWDEDPELTDLEIGEEAFYNCSKLTKIGNVGSVGKGSFANCSSLTRITINYDEDIDDEAFLNCTSLLSVEASVLKRIGKNAFEGCTSLKSVLTGSALSYLETIDNEAFKDCTSLASILLRKSVKNIGNRAFENCTSLKTINCQIIEPINIYNKDVFKGIQVSNAITLNVPEESVEAYKAAPVWKDFFSASAIDGIKMDSKKKAGIFTLDGKKVSDAENLPSGIYIKNGKKVTIK